MRKKTFEKLLKEAIIMDAEEQGARFSETVAEPIPAKAQERFDAALHEEDKTEKDSVSSVRPAQKTQQKVEGRRWVAYRVAAASLAAAVLVVVLLAGIGTVKSQKSAEAVPNAEAMYEPTETHAGQYEMHAPPREGATYAPVQSTAAPRESEPGQYYFKADTKTITLVESYWTGWTEEQPAPILHIFEDVSEGTVIYDNSFFGTIQVEELTDDAIRFRIEHSCFVEPNEDGSINLTAKPIASITIKRGEEKTIASMTMDFGVRLTISVGMTYSSTP